MTIPNQKHFLFVTFHQAFQQFACLMGFDRALNSHELHLTTRIDRSNHVQPKSSPRSLNDWRMPFRGSCLTRIKIRPNTRFVFKTDDGFFLLRPLLNLRVDSLFPCLNALRILLIGTIQRLFAGKSKLPRQTSHRVFIGLHPLNRPYADLFRQDSSCI